MDNVMVIDYGSRTIKAGTVNNFPNEKEPGIITPTAVLRDDPINNHPNSSQIHRSSEDPPTSLPSTSYPVQNARIVDFDAFESLLYYILYDLSGWELGDEGSLAFAEPLHTPKSDREHLTQICFEVFNAPGLFLQDTASLSLYTVGKLSGCVVDLGYGKVDVTAVTDGAPLLPSSRRLDYSCSDVTKLLGKLMEGASSSSSSGSGALKFEQLEQLQEQCAKALDSAAEYSALMRQQATLEPTKYTLPDGTEVSVGNQGATIAEAFLQPDLLGLDTCGVVEAAMDCVATGLDSTQRKVVLENMYVCGGGSCISGLGGRIVRDLKLQVPPTISPQMCPTPEYMPPSTGKYAAWIGGAITAKVVQQQNQFVTKAEYEEGGPCCVHKKCS